MNRDKIKIIEFDPDDDGPSSPGPAGDTTIKIVEFDDESPDQRNPVATAKDIGRIKIIEFEDEATTKTAPIPEQPRTSARAVKIKEFDKDDRETTRAGSDRTPKIKIMEFE